MFDWIQWGPFWLGGSLTLTVVLATAYCLRDGDQEDRNELAEKFEKESFALYKMGWLTEDRYKKTVKEDAVKIREGDPEWPIKRVRRALRMMKLHRR